MKIQEESYDESSSTDHSYWCIEYLEINNQLSLINKSNSDNFELNYVIEKDFLPETNELDLNFHRKGNQTLHQQNNRIEHAHSNPVIVEKRNARERKRVKAVNEAFAKLRQMVPSVACQGKRVSKVKTLKKAVEYISELKRALEITKNPEIKY
uniref:CSON015137 protein n=1 Tax=Culicoides sonorensis TaxID=179676 RepID=A0A336MGL8_CULSO